MANSNRIQRERKIIERIPRGRVVDQDRVAAAVVHRERVGSRCVEPAVVQGREVGLLEAHRVRVAGHERRAGLGDEQGPAAGPD